MGEIIQNGILYSGGGGTSVIPNPSESATDTLNKLKIDSTVYSIASGGANISATTKTLSSSGWNESSLQQTITVSGITSSSIIWVAPLSDTSGNYSNYTKSGIRAISQSTNSITFKCDTIPSTNISVNICYC